MEKEDKEEEKKGGAKMSDPKNGRMCGKDQLRKTLKAK